MLPVATMVNSPTDEAMVERIDRIEKKLDDLATSMARRFDDVDRRFDAVGAEFTSVTGALVEQRQYTEFAFSKLEAKMDEGFASLAARMDAGFKAADSRATAADSRATAADARATAADARFMRLERKLDQFIEAFGAPKRGPRRR